MADDDYRIVMPEEAYRVELHVLARAYQDACLALTQRLPKGLHRIENLDITFEFGDRENRTR